MKSELCKTARIPISKGQIRLIMSNSNEQHQAQEASSIEWEMTVNKKTETKKSITKAV